MPPPPPPMPQYLFILVTERGCTIIFCRILAPPQCPPWPTLPDATILIYFNDELGWPILSKRRKDARLILFYKIINNLAQVPHEHILTKAYEGTRKKNNHKFRHIAVNTSPYSLGSRFSPKLSVRGISCHSLIPLL